jgi:hypothetical protein
MGFEEQRPDNGTCYIFRQMLLEGQDVRRRGYYR